MRIHLHRKIPPPFHPAPSYYYKLANFDVWEENQNILRKDCLCNIIKHPVNLYLVFIPSSPGHLSFLGDWNQCETIYLFYPFNFHVTLPLSLIPPGCFQHFVMQQIGTLISVCRGFVKGGYTGSKVSNHKKVLPNVYTAHTQGSVDNMSFCSSRWHYIVISDS